MALIGLDRMRSSLNLSPLKSESNEWDLMEVRILVTSIEHSCYIIINFIFYIFNNYIPLVFLVEWNASQGRYVDFMAKHKQEGGVRDSMGYMPHPPHSKPDKQGPGVDISLSLGGNLSEAERMGLARREFRFV